MLMLLDRERIEFYDQALAHCCHQKIVLEVGTGTGILSILAAFHGAQHVYTIERDPFLARLAKKTIQRLGLSRKITVIVGDSTKIKTGTFPKADVFVQEVFGSDPLNEGLLAAVHDVQRFLKSDCVFVPEKFSYCLSGYQSKMLSPPKAFRFRNIWLKELDDLRDQIPLPVWSLASSESVSPVVVESRWIDIKREIMKMRGFQAKVIVRPQTRAILKKYDSLLVTFKLGYEELTLNSWTRKKQDEKQHWAPFSISNLFRRKATCVISADGLSTKIQ